MINRNSEACGRTNNTYNFSMFRFVVRQLPLTKSEVQYYTCTCMIGVLYHRIKAFGLRLSLLKSDYRLNVCGPLLAFGNIFIQVKDFLTKCQTIMCYQSLLSTTSFFFHCLFCWFTAHPPWANAAANEKVS